MRFGKVEGVTADTVTRSEIKRDMHDTFVCVCVCALLFSNKTLLKLECLSDV